MSFERVMGTNRHIMENNGDLEPIARNMNPTLWVPSENLSFGLLPKSKGYLLLLRTELSKKRPQDDQIFLESRLKNKNGLKNVGH